MKKARENDLKQTTPLKYDIRIEGQISVTQANGIAQNAEKSSQHLSTSYDNKTPPTQTSPHGSVRNTSPSIANAVQKTMESLGSEDNPASVPPPSVFTSLDPSSVGSPQRPTVTATVTSISPPSATSGLVPVTRVPSSTLPNTTRVSFSPMQNASIPASSAHQNVPARSFAPSGSQPVGQSITATLTSSQPSHIGSVVNHPPSSNPLNLGSTNLTPSLSQTVPSSTGMAPSSLPQSMHLSSSITQGFPNVVATCTSLPSTSASPLYTQLGSSHTPAVSMSSLATSIPTQARQPVGSMAAAVAAAESAVLQANAQILPSQRIQGSTITTGQLNSAISMPGHLGTSGGMMTSSVAHMPTQPSMNIGVVSTHQPSVTQTMIPSTQSTPQQQTVSGTAQSNILGTQQGTPGQQLRPLLSVQHANSQPGAPTGQPALPPQFGATGSQPGHTMQQQVPVQSQAQSGLPQDVPGQQSLPPHQGLKGPQPNPGIPPTQQSHIQPQSQAMLPQSTPSALQQVSGQQQQQPTHSGTQPNMATGQPGIPPSQQMHQGQPFGTQLQQQVH